jgi:AcrR family transcriptional regulator
MARLWNDTIAAHRREVRDAVLDAAASLAIDRSPLSITMSQIADSTGIGRATLYKYFPDVESILLAWHERQMAHHLETLAQAREKARDPRERLQTVLETWALIAREIDSHHGTELAAFLHRDTHTSKSTDQLQQMIRGLVSEASAEGNLRKDVAPDELATYCLHALTAASALPSRAAVRRLVAVTMAGLQVTPAAEHAAATRTKRKRGVGAPSTGAHIL